MFALAFSIPVLLFVLLALQVQTSTEFWAAAWALIATIATTPRMASFGALVWVVKRKPGRAELPARLAASITAAVGTGRAATEAPVLFRSGFIDSQSSSVKLSSAQGIHGSIGLGSVGHFNEAKAS